MYTMALFKLSSVYFMLFCHASFFIFIIAGTSEINVPPHPGEFWEERSYIREERRCIGDNQYKYQYKHGSSRCRFDHTLTSSYLIYHLLFLPSLLLSLVNSLLLPYILSYPVLSYLSSSLLSPDSARIWSAHPLPHHFSCPVLSYLCSSLLSHDSARMWSAHRLPHHRRRETPPCPSMRCRQPYTS